MNLTEVKKQRKQNLIQKIEQDIKDFIIKYGWTEFCIQFSDDLYEDIKQYFTDKGFKVWRESFYYPDFDGFETSKKGFNYYIGI